MAELDADGAVDIDPLGDKVLPDADGVVAAVEEEAEPVNMKGISQAVLRKIFLVDFKIDDFKMI